MARVNGKVTVASQVYIGPPARVVDLMKGSDDETAVRLKVEEFGALWAALQMDADIDIASIIVTDNTDWTTTDIIEANLDRWEVEGCFRQSNSTMSVRPIHHWTDSKIRCHLLCCVIALTYLRRLELRVERYGIKRTARDILDDLSHLHSALILDRRSRKPRRMIEQPGKTQEEVLKALGHCIDTYGVLQALD
jgi:transposase